MTSAGGTPRSVAELFLVRYNKNQTRETFMKRTKGILQQLIGWPGLLCIVVSLSLSSAKAGEALRQRQAVLGKWKEIESAETIEFFKNGTVSYELAVGKLQGTYEIVGMIGDVEQNADQLVGFGEIRVDFHGIGPLALPAIGKVSSSGDELVLTLSNGRAGKFKKVK